MKQIEIITDAIFPMIRANVLLKNSPKKARIDVSIIIIKYPIIEPFSKSLYIEKYTNGKQYKQIKLLEY